VVARGGSVRARESQSQTRLPDERFLVRQPLLHTMRRLRAMLSAAVAERPLSACCAQDDALTICLTAVTRVQAACLIVPADVPAELDSIARPARATAGGCQYCARRRERADVDVLIPVAHHLLNPPANSRATPRRGRLAAGQTSPSGARRLLSAPAVRDFSVQAIPGVDVKPGLFSNFRKERTLGLGCMVVHILTPTNTLPVRGLGVTAAHLEGR
jgi:hypothetical protein